MKPWQSRSSASVVTPGTTCGVMKSSTSAERRPAWRMPSKSAALCSLMRRSSAEVRSSTGGAGWNWFISRPHIPFARQGQAQPRRRPLQQRRLCGLLAKERKPREPYVSAADPQKKSAASGAGPAGEKVVTAAVLIIGNEILSGRTQDANLAYIAKGLNEVGVTLREARVIPDVEAT